MAQKKRRGYPVAVLVGFDPRKTTIWRIYSESARLERTLEAPEKNDTKATYGHFEEVVDLLRPVLKAGVRSILVSSPPRSNLHAGFLEHIRRRHRWLTEGGAAIGEIQGSADTPASIQELAKNGVLMNVLGETTSQEYENIQAELERTLEHREALYTVEEIQQSIRGEDKPRIILMTDAYYEEHKRSRRLQSMMQLAQNNLVQTRIIRLDTKAGARISQFGGLISLK